MYFARLKRAQAYLSDQSNRTFLDESILHSLMVKQRSRINQIHTFLAFRLI